MCSKFNSGNNFNAIQRQITWSDTCTCLKDSHPENHLTNTYRGLVDTVIGRSKLMYLHYLHDLTWQPNNYFKQYGHTSVWDHPWDTEGVG